MSSFHTKVYNKYTNIFCYIFDFRFSFFFLSLILSSSPILKVLFFLLPSLLCIISVCVNVCLSAPQFCVYGSLCRFVFLCRSFMDSLSLFFFVAGPGPCLDGINYALPTSSGIDTQHGEIEQEYCFYSMSCLIFLNFFVAINTPTLRVRDHQDIQF